MEKTADGWRFTEFSLGSHTERNVTAEAGDKECGACHQRAKTTTFSAPSRTAPKTERRTRRPLRDPP